MGGLSIQDKPVTAMYWHEVPWVSGTFAGIRHVRAPDPQSAAADVERHPSDFGLPHESVIVGRARLIEAPAGDELL